MAGNSPGIRVGTAITTLLKTGPGQGSQSLVGYRDFDDAKAEDRRAHLLSSLEDDPLYQFFRPSPLLGLPLRPREASLTYFSWPSIPELFYASSPGITTSRDPLLVDIDLGNLIEKISFYLDPLNSNEAVARAYPVAMNSTARFDALETRSELIGNGFRRWQIFRYLYRPFDLRWIYWEPNSKLLDENREISSSIGTRPVVYLSSRSRIV